MFFKLRVCFSPFCPVVLSVLPFVSFFSTPLSFSVSGHLLSMSVCLVGPEPAVPHQSYFINTEKNLVVIDEHK